MLTFGNNSRVKRSTMLVSTNFLIWLYFGFQNCETKHEYVLQHWVSKKHILTMTLDKVKELGKNVTR